MQLPLRDNASCCPSLRPALVVEPQAGAAVRFYASTLPCIG